MADVNLTNQVYKPSGDINLDLVKVEMRPDFAGKVNLGALFGACTGRIGRLEIDTVIGDGIHFGAACHDLVIESGIVYCHDLAPSALHWDCIQFMGGYRITVKNMLVIMRSPDYDTEGRCCFMAAGQSPPDLEDVVFDGCYFEAHRDPISTKAKVFEQVGSLRSGARNSVFCEAQAGTKPFKQTAAAVSPVNSGNIVIPKAVPVPLHP